VESKLKYKSIDLSSTYIKNISMEKRFCLNCFRFKKEDAFGWENSKNKSKGRKSKCKECCTEIEARRFYERMLEKFPENYWECDVCDHIVNIKKGYCTKCKEPKNSENIPSALSFI
jgi:hypothetical protein